ncbi:hypothetical protein BU23DRAFT_568845 [Bimuria novae-zelandiae CBS 107.79]|uniref:Uncharacterized protein n=1 Tax=Bimuria novae-zelandiae CBS 107.79 TaxID=1447943 RepID=A0A6A5V703_9PLEO|nr:hypothetical protein BU23DRAFT_568845 [Bimuria novae-zelandiae CBS 107.79]
MSQVLDYDEHMDEDMPEEHPLISLVVFESALAGKRIFTRDLLRKAADSVAAARQNVKNTHINIRPGDPPYVERKHWQQQRPAAPVYLEWSKLSSMAKETRPSTPKDPAYHNPRHQHLVASSIAKFLGEKYSETNEQAEPLQIVAYDPVYTKLDLHILSQLPQPITIVSDPHHYLAITPDSLVVTRVSLLLPTLVMCLYCPCWIPIYEIVADMHYPSDPAAWIRAEHVDIGGKKSHEAGLVNPWDNWTPRVGDMFELYDKMDLEDLDGWEEHDVTADWIHVNALYWRHDRSEDADTDVDPIKNLY